MSSRIGLLARHVGAAMASAATLNSKRVYAEPTAKKKSYYDVLGLAHDATSDQIRKAYKRAAVTNHPDKGGDEEKFKEISRAYEVLSDPDRRRQYDQFGENAPGGFQPGSGPDFGDHNFQDPFDIFQRFFGSAGFGGEDGFTGFHARHGPSRTEDLLYRIPCTLDELYFGASREINFRRRVLCASCEGQGGKRGTCGACQGRGVEVTTKQFGNQYMRMQQTCRTCGGHAQVITEQCPGCHGQGMLEQKEVLRVAIPRGAGEGHRIRFAGKADEAPHMTSGDVIVEVALKPHKHFHLLPGGHLLAERRVKFGDAVCGIHEDIKHLDGETLRLLSKDIVQNGDIRKIPGKGMPQGAGRFGDLFVRFIVENPPKLSWKNADEREMFRKRLGGAAPSRPWLSDAPTEIETLRVDPSEFNRQAQQQDSSSPSCNMM